MNKIIKIAEINGANSIRAKQIAEKLENQGFLIIFDEEYDYIIHVCVYEE